MALQRQVVPINLRDGIRGKQDQRIAQANGLATLTNAVFDDADTIVQRGGHTAHSIKDLAPSVAGHTDVKAAARTFTNGDTLYLESAAGVHAVVPDVGVAQLVPDLGNAHFVRAGMVTRGVSGIINRFPSNVTSPAFSGGYDFASNGQYSVFAWEEFDSATSRGVVRWLVLREADGAILMSQKISGTDHFINPKVIVSASGFFVYYAKYTNAGSSFSIWVTGVRVTSITTPIVDSEVFASQPSGTVTGVVFDCDCDANSTAAMLAVVDRNSTVSIQRLSTTDGGDVTGTWTVTPDDVPAQITALVTNKVATGKVYLTALFSPLDNRIQAFSRDITAGVTSSIVTLVTLGGSSDPRIGRIGAIDKAKTDSAFFVAYDYMSDAFQTPSNPTLEGLGVLKVEKDFSATTAGVGFGPGVNGGPGLNTPSGWHIAGHPVLVGARVYLPVMLLSETQPTVYVLDVGEYFTTLSATAAPPLVVARVDYGECGFNLQNWFPGARLAECAYMNLTLTIPFSRWVTDLQLAGGKDVQPAQIARADIDFASQLGQSELSGITVLAGACPHVCDRQNVVEEGFHHAPEIFNTSMSTSGSYGPFPHGTFSVTVTHGWEDAQGNWHESAPSQPKQVVAGVSADYLTLLSIIAPTSKVGAKAILYRTELSGTVYYRALGEDGAALADADLIKSSPLYVTGGVLEHEPMPAHRSSCLHDGRLVMFGVGDGLDLAYSTRGLPGAPPAGNSLFSKRAPRGFGRLVAGASLDEKLVVFGERQVGLMLGAGPNALGEQDGFSELFPRIHEMGCNWDSPKSVVIEPAGVWFRAPQGLRLVLSNVELARDQEGKEIGADVDDLVGVSSVVGVVGGSKQQVQFHLLPYGGSVVWDYQWRKWSQFTANAALQTVDAAFAASRRWYLRAAPALGFYDEGVVADEGTIPQMGFTSAWVKFAGPQGMQRVYKMSLLGQKLSGAGSLNLVVKAGYDYSTAFASEYNGDAVVSSTGRFQVQHPFWTQKCEAFRVFVGVTPSSTMRLRLSDLSLLLGVKRGIFKMSPGDQV